MENSSNVLPAYRVIAPMTTMLTEREREVSALIAHGSTNPEIATHLGIAVTTVRTHVDNIFVKLGVHRRVQIAQFYWLSHSPAASTLTASQPERPAPV